MFKIPNKKIIEIPNKKFELVYLYHSNSADFHRHWKNIKTSNTPFYKNARDKLEGRELKGLAIIWDFESEPFIYAIYGVVEHDDTDR